MMMKNQKKNQPINGGRTIKKGLFAWKTFYSVYENVSKGSRHCWFKFVIYARLSKINWKPCIHYEWRIKKASEIKKRTGIITIRHLLSFDHGTFFEKMEKKYIIHEKLDEEKIGRVLSGLERRKVLTKRQVIRVDLAFAHFSSYYGINSISDFTEAIRKECIYFDKRRGPKNPWARKVRKLRNFSFYSRPL